MPLVEGSVLIESLFGDTSTTVIPGPVSVVTVGAQGPQGIPGPEGPPGPSGGGTLTAIAGSDIALGTVLVMKSGLVYPADPTTSGDAILVVGLSITAGVTTDTITYIPVGEFDSLSGLTPGPYWVGLNGVLSTTPQAMGAVWLKFAGVARSATDFIYEPWPPVLLS